ncbi:MAG TPA: DUF1800 family protein [Opitutaceae bacterium]|nr:DUF1800 family protein [Opitutaceae bacterium]
MRNANTLFGVLLALAAQCAIGAEFGDRLVNLSTRADVGTGDDVMIAGFVIGEGASKQVLVRAAGPALLGYNVPGVLGDPTLTILDGDGNVVASNDNWGSTDEFAMAEQFAAVGAFDFASGSKDSALVVTLAPGLYTAVVSGVASGTGIGLVEVYDLSGPSRMINLSTRARVGTDAGIVTSGLSVSPVGPPRRLLIRAAGPALVGYNVEGTISDPQISVISLTSNAEVASNDNWETGNTEDMAAVFTEAGAFAFAPGSTDAALVADFPAGNYTIEVRGADAGTGITLVEVYDLTDPTLVFANVKATVAATDTSGAPPAILTFTRSGSLASVLTVPFAVSGTAVPGVDITSFPASVTFPPNTQTVTLPVYAIPGTSGDVYSTVTLTPGAGYSLGSPNSATVSVLTGPGTLYVATLRAPSGSSSTAFGSATIRVTPAGTMALVNVGFSGLSSPQVSAHLAVGAPGEDGPFVKGLPYGQVDSAQWTFQQSGLYTPADLIQALKDGLIYVSIDTVNFTSGELRGNFIFATGSQAFIEPPDPPALPGGVPTHAEAARFLSQATFGATLPSIDQVVQGGYSAWIDAQIATPASSHRSETAADFAANPTGGAGNNTRPGGVHRQAAWWKIVLKGNDQLRQRVAFALSEIFVISDVDSTVNNWQEGAANYYDILANNAFGNFRQLLEEVSLSPMMGAYLSHLRNSKSVNGTFPDENYAREVMQLFTIGLNQLQPDGSLKLDSLGLPVPTYEQTTITETAKVFTGWGFHSVLPNPNFRTSSADFFNPMMLYPGSHEDASKTIIGGIVLPANQGGAQDLDDTLDALFYHTNAAPFFSRGLIQRLVTSNPSPGFVYRVARVFEDNGFGVRGDLAAVVRAILLDYEARANDVTANPGYGKLKEPLLRMTALMRAFDAVGDNNRFAISNPQSSIEQASLRAPSVFNFFEPTYVVPGALASAGLVAPEFQILTDTTAIGTPNYIYRFLFNTVNGVSMDYTAWLPLATQPQQLVETLDLVIAAGSSTQAARDTIIEALNSLPGSTTDTNRVRSAAYLMLTSPGGSVQR